MRTLAVTAAEGETTDEAKIRKVYPGCVGCIHAKPRMTFAGIAGNDFTASRDCPVQGENTSPAVAAACQNAKFTRITDLD